MIDALVSGKLIKNPSELKTGQSGAVFCNFMISVSVGDPQPVLISGIAFGDASERISKLGAGDAICVAGSLRPNEWVDKSSGEVRHGLNIAANQVLSVYDVSKRRATA